MALAHNLGFSHGGHTPELRAHQWQVQKNAGLALLPVAADAWHVEAMSQAGDPRHPLPTFTVDQAFDLSWAPLLEHVQEAKALGHAVKPVVIGPLTYLWLGKTKGAEFDKLELLERLLPLYDQVFNRLAGQGVEWVQIDEPILVLDLPQAWKSAFERVYNILQRAPLKKLIATYGGGLEENLGLAANLPVDGLHVDLVCAPDRYTAILDRLPAYKVLSLGLVDGRSGGSGDLEDAVALVQHAAECLGDRLWLAPSCALQQGPLGVAVQQCEQVAMLAKVADAGCARAAA
ncbi:5-methyltetrahydropteroyltriglutamate--homocysteine methyltransferase [Pseudomonas sp. NPDC089401]|uniref:5-methyltetrahydropteroyltriglutamate-- homocysteine methyltransferase n=1 Tax=Pseudomonas sp. NPDC089401 TaxID=3364462 RepID=UPI0038120D1D